MADFFKYPRPAVSGAADHDAVDVVAFECRRSLFRRVDVAVADDRDMHSRVAFYLADQRPVGLAAVKLRPRPAVDRQRGDSRVLQPFGDLDDVFRVFVPAEAGFDGYRQAYRFDDPPRHFDHLRHVAHHAAAGSARGNLAYRAAEIDVDQIGPCRLGDPRRLDHRFDLVAVELDAHRAFVVVSAEFGDRFGRVADQSVARYEFGVDHVRSEPLAHVSERRIGHVFHRGQEQRLVP